MRPLRACLGNRERQRAGTCIIPQLVHHHYCERLRACMPCMGRWRPRWRMRRCRRAWAASRSPPRACTNTSRTACGTRASPTSTCQAPWRSRRCAPPCAVRQAFLSLRAAVVAFAGALQLFGSGFMAAMMRPYTTSALLCVIFLYHPCAAAPAPCSCSHILARG